MYNKYYIPDLDDIDNYKLDVIRRLYNSYFPNIMLDTTPERLKMLLNKAMNNVPFSINEINVLTLLNICGGGDNDFTTEALRKKINYTYDLHKRDLYLWLIILADGFSELIFMPCELCVNIVVSILNVLIKIVEKIDGLLYRG